MTMLPEASAIKLGLVIDLDICVGCQACVVNCKEWNTAGYGAPLADVDAYGGVLMRARFTFQKAVCIAKMRHA